MIIDFLYNIFIFPIVQIIEITFSIAHRILKDNVLSIIAVSAVVTLCTMPLYFIAEKWNQVERDIQKKLKPKVDKIKSVFKGDEQYMVLSTYYRQNNYHPLYSFRNSLGVLVQVPFFIAAYSYLSHLDILKGTSFLFIQSLGGPDQFLSLGGFSLNILPILMTLINCASGAVYAKGLLARDKVQIYGIALVFLVLLYNSPAGLVLYWTMNNVFSLFKNILSKTKHWKEIVYAALCLCIIFIIIRYALLGFNPNRLFVSGIFSLFFFTLLFIKLFRFIQNKISRIVDLEHSSLSGNSAYILSLLILFVLCGLVIPGSLIASSVPEFSFLDSYTTPLPFLGTAVIQATGIFLFWPICVFFLFSKKVKYGLSLTLSLLCISALVNTFLFPLDYGHITTTFRFSDPGEADYGSVITNGLVTISIWGVFTYLLLSRRKFIFHSFQLIVIAALVCFSAINIYKINRDFKKYEQLLAGSSGVLPSDKPTSVYHLSRNGKNVILIMLDAAVSAYVPYIFEEKPQMLNDFSGFTYYSNCASFGFHTRIGLPLVFGGYEYQPENIQKGRFFATEKHNEALLLMPLLFKKEDYRITVTDPTLANYGLKPDLSIFDPYPGISAQNIMGRYTNSWLYSHPELKLVSVPKLLQEFLMRFSLLKTAPPILRVLIYDKAKWLKPGGNLSENQLTLDTMDSYTTLDYLPLLTDISDDNVNTYTAIVNDLVHEPALLQLPDYVPATDLNNIGDSPFVNEKPYHANMAAFLLVGKWLRFLQEQGIYDNTRIIIASDHGNGIVSHNTKNMQLPNGHWLSRYQALLMVKDFNSHGDMVTDATFMTNGDVPLITMDGLIDTPQNPFSGNNIKNDKEDGIVVATSGLLQYIIKEDQWMHVRDDIFNPDNWENIKR